MSRNNLTLYHSRIQNYPRELEARNLNTTTPKPEHQTSQPNQNGIEEATTQRRPPVRIPPGPSSSLPGLQRNPAQESRHHPKIKIKTKHQTSQPNQTESK
ncbi:hypothetical protein Dimus_027427 [Dionaea muscipula]